MDDRDDLEGAALADRLKVGFDALATEAGDPPPFSKGLPARTGRKGPSRMLTVAAAAVVLVALVGGALAWLHHDEGVPAERVATGPDATNVTDPAIALPVEGTRWWLVAVEDSGTPVELRTEQSFGFQIRPGPPCEKDEECAGATMLTASDACNGVHLTIEVGDDALELGRQVGPTTAMGCSGRLTDVLRAVLTAGEVAYEVHGDELVLRRGGTVLTYQASEGPFAPTSGQFVDEGEREGASYRLLWENGSLGLQVADTDEDQARGGSGLGDDPGRINMRRDVVAGQAYVWAIVPIEATRIVYEPVDGDPVDLQIHTVDSATSAVVGAFVDDAPPVWQLVAYDADGIELHRYRWGPRDDQGAGLYLSEVVTTAGFPDCCTQAGAREAFTVDHVAMSIGGSPLEPTAPRNPRLMLEGADAVTLAQGVVVTGTVREEAAIRFDCAGIRYEVRAPNAEAAKLLGVAPPLSAAAGCPVLAISDE